MEFSSLFSTDHWARHCPKMDDGSSSPKKRNLGAYAHGARTCSNTDSSRDEKVFVRLVVCEDPLCGTAISPVQDDDECEAHAAFLVVDWCNHLLLIALSKMI